MQLCLTKRIGKKKVYHFDTPLNIKLLLRSFGLHIICHE